MAKEMEKRDPHVLRQALAIAQDSIFGLVIQDHIESIGNANTIKWG
jgi:hypothetical protein